jgi:serine/threonine-protein kinase RsbW
VTIEIHTRLVVPAQAERLRDVRDVVRSVAVSAGAPRDRVEDMVLAVAEACANVVAHAYAEGGGDMHVVIDRRDEALVVVVSDSGAPIVDRRSEGAGVGLQLIRGLSDDLVIEGPGEAGTVVAMTFRLATS